MIETPAKGPETLLSEQKTAAQAEMLGNRLKKRYRHLRRWARRTGAGAYRLYDRDIPEIPLVLDFYGDAESSATAGAATGAIAGALYERPYEKEGEARWLAAMTEAVSGALGIPGDSIFLKERSRQRGRAQYEKIRSRGEVRDITEGGLRFRVNLSDYLDTGLFPDHRKTRGLVREISPGKRVLNLFCYTASFSVYAAAAGAQSVDSVDLSNTYLDWAKTNFALNKLEALPVSPAALCGGAAPLPPFRLIRADALRFLEAAASLRWDLIILDPPAFSNSKNMERVLDLKRDHRGLIARCLSLLAPAGRLIFSANLRGFALNPEDFPGTAVEDMRETIRDEDFAGRRLPAVYSFTVMQGKDN
ncbi:MAG: class I SAM-dependent methyltransferase [Treponema sp.]|jgi:23S rRNA G2069 N7-methylase RlmK/C1962 C5-methylase RlmI|nr:class I SAM-dependent methyltransferase [Treponema sp.]